jgi:hypothetical protein
MLFADIVLSPYRQDSEIERAETYRRDNMTSMRGSMVTFSVSQRHVTNPGCGDERRQRDCKVDSEVTCAASSSFYKAPS